MDKRCTFPESDGFHRCGSCAFNLHQQGINQGTLCDVHYWQTRTAELTDECNRHADEILAWRERFPTMEYRRMDDIVCLKFGN